MTDDDPETGLRDAIADAIERAELPFEMQLIRLVDGVSTYELRYLDTDEVFQFNDQDALYNHVAQRRRQRQADEILTALAAARPETGTAGGGGE